VFRALAVDQFLIGQEAFAAGTVVAAVAAEVDITGIVDLLDIY
jgi:hypothetical protein